MKANLGLYVVLVTHHFLELACFPVGSVSQVLSYSLQLADDSGYIPLVLLSACGLACVMFWTL